jgi:type IV pilus assembly protein PilC
MSSFKYTATTPEGKQLSGSVEARSKEAVINTLRNQNLRPLTVVAERKKLSEINIGKKGVKRKELVIFTRQLSTMISAGVPLNRCLTTLGDQAESNYFKSVIADINKDVEGGMSIGDSIAKFPNIFSDVYVNMVKAGEAGGILDEILKRLAAQVEQDDSMHKKIKSAMTYPVVIGGITVIAFFVIMVFVMPKLGQTLKDLGGEDAQLPIYSQVMLGISAFMQQNIIIILIIFAVIVFAFKRYIGTPRGKYNFHAFLLRMPISKVLITKIAIARFSRTFASLMAAGVSVLEALEVTGGAIGNKVIEKELAEAAKEVKNGKQLSETLASSPHFPAIVPQMLAIGEETGQTDVILVKVADFYEEEVEATIDGLSSLIEPLMIIVLGGMVGMIAVSVMGPIASLGKNIQN